MPTPPQAITLTTNRDPSHTSTSARDFIFDRGDVLISVNHNGEVIEGKVSADALSLASQVWKKFLFSPWGEGKEPRQNVKQIDFTEDDSEALLILLNICHLRFNKIPPTLRHESLLQVAVLCDQYDCVGIVKMWLTKALWLAKEPSELSETFDILAWGILLHHPVDNEGLFWNDLRMPPNIIETILKRRRGAISSMLDIPYNILASYTNTMESQSVTTLQNQRANQVHVCVYKNTPDHCDATTYGSLVLGLSARGLYPRPQHEKVTISLTELKHQLRKMPILQVPNHHNCFLGFTGQIDEAFRNIKNPILDSHIRHMEHQQRRLHR